MRNCMVIKFSQRFAQLPCRPWSCYDGFGGPLCMHQLAIRFSQCPIGTSTLEAQSLDLSTGQVDSEVHSGWDRMVMKFNR